MQPKETVLHNNRHILEFFWILSNMCSKSIFSIYLILAILWLPVLCHRQLSEAETIHIHSSPHSVHLCTILLRLDKIWLSTDYHKKAIFGFEGTSTAKISISGPVQWIFSFDLKVSSIASNTFKNVLELI